MAERFTIYCKRSVAGLKPEELFKGFQIADLQTIAEEFDIDDSVIESALGQLRMENVKPDAEFRHYRLSYRPDVPDIKKQVDIDRWETPEDVRGVVAEVIEDLAPRGASVLKRIRPHLNATIDIVNASFGSTPDQVMAPVLASEIARWIAEKYDGIIRDNSGKWWKLGTYHEYRRM